MGVPLRNEFGELLQDRIEVAMDSVVPDTVPKEIQEDWETKGFVFEDPLKDHIAAQEGPPRISLPPMLSQKMEQAKRMGSTRGGIPPRPVHKPT
jgi:hypothetical protein